LSPPALGSPPPDLDPPSLDQDMPSPEKDTSSLDLDLLSPEKDLSCRL
jgi:hypothetical protein